jgi:hypothetical protein
MPQGAVPDVQNCGGAAEVAGTPDDEDADAIELGELELIEPAPFVPCGLEPLKVQESPDSGLLLLPFAKTHAAENHDWRGFWGEEALFPPLSE